MTIELAARTPGFAFSPGQRRVLAELLAAAIAGVESPSAFDEETEPAPRIDGRPDFEPVANYAWAAVPGPGGWTFEWTVPALDVAYGTVAGLDPVASSRVEWDCVDAHEVFDFEALAWDGYEPFPESAGVVVAEEDGATLVVHDEFRLEIRDASVRISPTSDDYDVEWSRPGLDERLVELVHELTAFRLVAQRERGVATTLADAIRFEAACQACWPWPDDALPLADDARRFADALLRAGALELAPEATSESVCDACARALSDVATASGVRASRLSAELVASRDVGEFYLDDATLAAWLEAW